MIDLYYLDGTPQTAPQRTTAMRTLPLLHAINRADKACHVDGLITTMQPMHPGRIRHVLADLVHKTARRLQDPMHCTRHVLVYHRFSFGSMETDGTLRFIGEIREILRRTHCHNHLGITQASVIAINRHSSDPSIDDLRKTCLASLQPRSQIVVTPR